MPFLNVDTVFIDPDFTDRFTVDRRVETVDTHGRSVVGHEYFHETGVVTAVSPNDLQRQEGYQAMSRSISIVCKFNLHGETSGMQPDIVVWRGSNYLVKHVDPYPQFGVGFFQAECSSMDRVDPALSAEVLGQLVFNLPANSGYFPIGL